MIGRVGQLEHLPSAFGERPGRRRTEFFDRVLRRAHTPTRGVVGVSGAGRLDAMERQLVEVRLDDSGVATLERVADLAVQQAPAEPTRARPR